MTETLTFPPLRDLPPGRLEARKRHLLAELSDNRRRSWRPVVVAVVAVAALAGAGVAIADGFGAFTGISAAQGPQTPAALKWAKGLQTACHVPPAPAAGSAPVYDPFCHLVLDSARLLSPGSNVYVITDSRGDLCNSVGFGGGCGPPLTASQPITAGGGNPAPTAGGELVVGGIALDDVKSVSFTIPLTGQAVTVPVRNNVWVYRQADSHAQGKMHCIRAHLADGSTVNPFPEVPCP